MPKKHALILANTEYRDAKLAPLSVPRRIAGHIVTMKLGMGEPPPGPVRHLGTMAIEAASPGDVIVVEQRTGGKRFARLEDVISQDELRTIFERYQKVAGYHVQQVGRAQG
jgi:regulator of RNase E activity RraA